MGSETILGVVGLLAGIGVTMTLGTPPSNRAARIMFTLTAAWVAGHAMWWSLTPPRGLGLRFWLAIATVVGAAVALLVAHTWIAARERAFVAGNTAPDVLLELSAKRKACDSLEPVDLAAYNDAESTARDVRIGPIDTGEYPIGFYTGDASTPPSQTFGRTRLRFAPVPHMAGKARCRIAVSNPLLTPSETLLAGVGVDAGLWWFIDRARERREYVEMTSAAGPDDRERAHERRRSAPIDVSLRVTYRDTSERQTWERIETLHYDPRTLTATLAHGPRRELIGPIAEMRFEHDHGRALLHITNGGSSADFRATLRINGAVRGGWGNLPDGALHARWSHSDEKTARIAQGQTCTLVLADNVREALPSFGFSQWHIKAISNRRPVDIEATHSYTPLADPPILVPDIVLDGEVIANPDMANGIQPFRVILRAEDAVAPGLS